MCIHMQLPGVHSSISSRDGIGRFGDVVNQKSVVNNFGFTREFTISMLHHDSSDCNVGTRELQLVIESFNAIA